MPISWPAKQDKQPITDLERGISAVLGGIIGILLGIWLCYLFTNGSFSRLGLFVVISMIPCAALGFYVPRVMVWLFRALATGSI
jgi:ABC-type antimicrobial peptide transport system permease subunit